MLPNSDAPGTPGTPGIPVVSNVLAVPDGARSRYDDDVDIRSAASTCSRRSPTRSTGTPSRPTSSPARSPTAVPGRTRGLPRAGPRTGEAGRRRLLGVIRDIMIGDLQIPAAQYNAVKDPEGAQDRRRDASSSRAARTRSATSRRPVGAAQRASRHVTLLNANILRRHHPRDPPPLRRGDDGHHQPRRRGRPPTRSPLRGGRPAFAPMSSRSAPAQARSAPPRPTSRRPSAIA